MVLILVTVFAVWLGWIVPRVQRQKKAVAWANSLQGGGVVYDYQGPYPSSHNFDIQSKPSTPQWGVDLLGIDCFATVTRLYLNNEIVADDLSMLNNLPRLKRFQLNATNVNSLEAFSDLGELEELGISVAPQLKSLNGIETCHSLKLLRIHGPVESLEPIRNLTQLESVIIMESTISDLEPVSNLKNLRMLQLFGADIEDLSALQTLSNLENLEIESTHVRDLTPLTKLGKLNNLDAGGLVVDDWTPLQHLKNLQYLDLQRTNFSDLGLLQGMHQLKSLSISGDALAGKLDLSYLASFDKLENLVLFDAKVTNAEALLELPALSRLFIPRNESISDEILANLKLKRPGIRISK